MNIKKVLGTFTKVIWKTERKDRFGRALDRESYEELVIELDRRQASINNHLFEANEPVVIMTEKDFDRLWANYEYYKNR